MFEYHVEYCHGMPDDYTLNQTARKGWRLAHAVPGSSGIALIWEKAPMIGVPGTLKPFGTYQGPYGLGSSQDDR